ncbi:retron St85 family effector protein [Phenylobacterium sp.]|uniref:retron St85 family effector protein n=1 Tax=Phenylobacterium sp. TaxID=1871053 RepID=UPI003BAA6427
MLDWFAEHLDADSIRVQAPSAVVFLCGGEKSDIGVPIPLSLRDAFLKIANNPAMQDRHVVLAEDINVFYLSRADYRDLLAFETDLAQICELIILFSESEGSHAELGAFSMVDEISERLLVILRDRHYEDESFIKLGPLLSLQNKYGEGVVYVLDDQDIGMNGNSARDVRIDVVRDRLQAPIVRRLSQIRDPSTFNSEKSGHVIKLIVALIQEFGALTIAEIEILLISAGVLKSQAEISGYLLCAEVVEWVVPLTKGARRYFFARPTGDAAQLRLRAEAGDRDKNRRRILIRKYWEENDPDRYRGIVQVSGVNP